MFELLTEEIKNTRFLLTMSMVMCLLVVFAGILLIILKGIVVTEAILVVFTAVVTAVTTLLGVSYNSYFKDRQASEIASIEKM